MIDKLVFADEDATRKISELSVTLRHREQRLEQFARLLSKRSTVTDAD